MSRLTQCQDDLAAARKERDALKTELANVKTQLADCKAAATQPPPTPPPDPTPIPAPTPTPSPSGQTAVSPWKSDSMWSKPLPANPEVLADSAQRITQLLGNTPGVPVLNLTEYGVAISVIPSATNVPTYSVIQESTYKSQGYPFFVNAAGRVPIPKGTKPTTGSDHHLVIYVEETHRYWDMWKARYDAGADQWYAGMGISATTDGYNGIPVAPNYGATSANLPLLGGLIRPEEIRAGRIAHRMSYCSNTRQSTHQYPATKHGCMSGCSGPITEGSLLQLNMSKAEIDALNAPAALKVVCHAMHEFGAYHRDGGGTMMGLYGESEDNARANRPSWSAVGLSNYVRLPAGIWNRMRVLAPTPANN